MSVEFYVTEKEKQLLDAMITSDHRTMKEACDKLGISKQTASNRMRGLRNRYQRAQELIKVYEEYRSKLPSRYM